MTSTLFSQLDLGKRSLQAQQAGMSVAGHNIANVNNDEYSRQRVDLDSQHPHKSRFGAGVDLKGVERIADRFVNQRYIAEQSRGGAMDIRHNGLKRVENIFSEIEGHGLRNALNEFWDAWGRLASNPEAEIARSDLINTSKTLADRVQGMWGDLSTLRREFNGRISERVEQVNQLAKELARLNKLVQQAERGAGETNDLRDKREAVLKDLSKIVQVDWFEDEDNLINVSIGNGFPLVLGRDANRMEASMAQGPNGDFTLRGLDENGVARDLTGELRSGELKELVQMRDETVVHFQERLDQLASELAYRVNKLHSTGTGLQASHESLRSSFAMKSDALDKPLPFLKDGSFELTLVDENGDALETYEIGVDAGKDSVRDIVQRINRTVGPEAKTFEARLNDDGSVTLASESPYRFVLGEDSSDFVVMMGFNNYFETLHGARDFRVNERLVEKPTHISTGKNLLPGDNQVALGIHELQFEPSMQGDSITFDEFYNGMMSDLGLMVNRSQADKENQELVLDEFKRLRDEISSVNMDEEVADMVQYQRGFDASAKFLSNVDEMTRTVISM